MLVSPQRFNGISYRKLGFATERFGLLKINNSLCFDLASSRYIAVADAGFVFSQIDSTVGVNGVSLVWPACRYLIHCALRNYTSSALRSTWHKEH